MQQIKQESVSGRAQISKGYKNASSAICFDMVTVLKYLIQRNGQRLCGPIGLHHGDDLRHSAAAVSVIGSERTVYSVPAPGKNAFVRGHVGKSSRMLDRGVIDARFGAFQIMPPRAIGIGVGIDVRIRAS